MWDNIVRITKIVFAGVGGFMSYIFGGFDSLLVALLSLMVLDYISGITKAIYNKKLNSHIGFKGLLKKVMILLVIVTVSVLQKAMSGAIPLRDIVLMFYLANEGISIIENLGAVIPIPDKVKGFFEQLQNNDDKKGE
jgi:toxin secretion/phage lysis holin